MAVVRLKTVCRQERQSSSHGRGFLRIIKRTTAILGSVAPI